MNEQTELQVQPIRAQAVGVVRQNINPMDIVQMCIDKGVGTETLTLAMTVRRELQAEQAKRDFDDALAAFQLECPPVIKTKSVEGAYKYAPFEEIVKTVGPCEAKNGFHHTLDTVDTEPGWVIAICNLTHRGGHTQTSRVKLPLGAKTRLMSDTQVYAAAQSFACRRAFCNALGIVPQGEDMDGRGQKPKPAGPSSVAPADMSAKDAARELWNTLAPVRGKANDWQAANQWMWDEAVLADTQAAPDLTVDEFKQATAKAKAKLSR